MIVKIWRNVMTYQGEESGDTEGFVAVPYDFKVDRFIVEKHAEPCNDGIYWYNE